MKKSEQVLYITLIDFLLQLLFLGLVLWVIFGLSKPSVSDKIIDEVGGVSQATESLNFVIDLMKKNGIKNPVELDKKIHAIIDPVGGIDPAIELIKSIQALMKQTGIRDPKQLIDTIRSLIDQAGNLQNASDLPARIDDLMRQAGINDRKTFFKWLGAVIDAADMFKTDEVAGLEGLSRFLKQWIDLMQKTNMSDPSQLLDALSSINQQRGKLDFKTFLERLKQWSQVGDAEQTLHDAKLGEEIAKAAGTDNIDQIKQWIEQGRKGPEESGAYSIPYIEMSSNMKEYSFDSGSAKLSSSFREKITNQVVPDIQEYINNDSRINLIEVIGHTDSVPSTSGTDKMDERLGNFINQSINNDNEPDRIQGSNTDLGLLRALQVVKLLKELCQQGKLTGIPLETGFRAYSSGSLTLLDGQLSYSTSQIKDDARRRIEIRLTRLGDKIQAK